VLVKGYVDRVEVAHRGQVVASHTRSYERHAQVLDPLHYLVTLGRKPATLDHSEVYRNWQLPANFAQLRERLEGCHGARAGARQYVRVLQLLARHSAERVSRAIALCLARDQVDADLVNQQAEQLAVSERTKEERATPESGAGNESGVVGGGTPLLPVSLKRYDHLLTKGETADEE
jgi:hypothetical protein